MAAQKTLLDYANEIVAILREDGTCEWMQPYMAEVSERHIRIECNGTTIWLNGPGGFRWRFYCEQALREAPIHREILARCSSASNMAVMMD